MSDIATSRRRFLATALAGLPVLLARPSLLAARPIASSRPGPLPDVRSLSLVHLHTHERLDADYWSGGTYVGTQLDAVNRVLRDWRTGDIYPIDPTLLDLLHDLVDATGTVEPFEVICGYRSPTTNEMLRRTGGGGVASTSLHLKGKAIDIRLPDVPLKRLRDAAISLKRGGVGFYPSSNFVHVDTGRFRTW